MGICWRLDLEALLAWQEAVVKHFDEVLGALPSFCYKMALPLPRQSSSKRHSLFFLRGSVLHSRSIIASLGNRSHLS